MPLPIRHGRAAAFHALQQFRNVRRWVELQNQVNMCLHDSQGLHAGSFLMGYGDEVAREKPRDMVIDRRFSVSGGPDEMDVDAISHLEKFADTDRGE